MGRLKWKTALVLTLVFFLVVGTEGGRRSRGERNKRGRPRAERQRSRRLEQSSSRVRDRSSRGLVPQLLANYSTPAPPPADEVGCNDAYLTCAYRGGCGKALQNYMVNCAELREGLTETCSKQCQFALIALLSTPEGERLMQCSCTSADKSGEESCMVEKARVEPCRSEVTWNTAPDTEVSCSAATWICAADPLCSTAMLYYRENCKAMFKGRKCGKKCKNSLDIMLRQKSAAKLTTCYCEGTEDYDCSAVRLHTDVLCFGKKVVAEVVETNEVEKVHSSGVKITGKTFIVLVSFFSTCFTTQLGTAISSFVIALTS